MYVVMKHPTVKCQKLTWDEACEVFGCIDTPLGKRIVLAETGFYGYEESIETYSAEEDFEEAGYLYFLGPYPDGGYWVTYDIEDYIEV